jgi:hypothetical protein
MLEVLQQNALAIAVSAYVVAAASALVYAFFGGPKTKTR